MYSIWYSCACRHQDLSNIGLVTSVDKMKVIGMSSLQKNTNVYSILNNTRFKESNTKDNYVLGTS